MSSGGVARGFSHHADSPNDRGMQRGKEEGEPVKGEYLPSDTDVTSQTGGNSSFPSSSADAIAKKT